MVIEWKVDVFCYNIKISTYKTKFIDNRCIKLYIVIYIRFTQFPLSSFRVIRWCQALSNSCQLPRSGNRIWFGFPRLANRFKDFQTVETLICSLNVIFYHAWYLTSWVKKVACYKKRIFILSLVCYLELIDHRISPKCVIYTLSIVFQIIAHRWHNKMASYTIIFAHGDAINSMHPTLNSQ